MKIYVVMETLSGYEVELHSAHSTIDGALSKISDPSFAREQPPALSVMEFDVDGNAEPRQVA